MQRIILTCLMLCLVSLSLTTTAAPLAPKLLDKAHKSGEVNVIIRLAPQQTIQPEAALKSKAAILQQRLNIHTAQGHIKQLLSTSEHHIKRNFRTLPYMALTVSPDALTQLANSPLVHDIMEDGVRKPLLDQSIPLIGAYDVWSAGFEGGDYAVAIIDSGIDADHAFLKSNVLWQGCFSTNYPRQKITSLCPNGKTTMEGEGAADATICLMTTGCDHGTHVAGIVAGLGSARNGVAPKAKLIAFQAFSLYADTESCNGMPSCLLARDSDIIAALEKVYDLKEKYKVAAVNLSLGGEEATSACDAGAKYYVDIIKQLKAAGIATIVAAGNEGLQNATTFPGCLSDVITVGASNKDDTVAYYSNQAPWVRIYAPGTAIRSSIMNDGFGWKSGTSMATPHVAGAWALLKSIAPNASVETLKKVLQETGTQLNPISREEAQRLGDSTRIQLDAAMQALLQQQN